MLRRLIPLACHHLTSDDETGFRVAIDDVLERIEQFENPLFFDDPTDEEERKRRSGFTWSWVEAGQVNPISKVHQAGIRLKAFALSELIIFFALEEKVIGRETS